jgi:hypothetical protein
MTRPTSKFPTSKIFDTFDRFARRVSDLVPAVPEPIHRPAQHCYLALIQRLVQIRREQNQATVTAFTSIDSGAGVTHVIETLAWELAKYTGQQVLLTTGGGLACPPVHLLWKEDEPIQHPVHRLVEVHGSGQRTIQNVRWQELRGLRQRFGFVLVDCPSMRESSAILTLGRASDGVVLVVAASETDRSEITVAQQALVASSANLLGVVLNKRTDPLPGFLSRLV